MPIPDAVAGPQTEPEPITEDHYPLQNAHIRACIHLSEVQEKHDRHEATDEELKQAEKSTETALLALENYQRQLDAKKEK